MNNIEAENIANKNVCGGCGGLLRPDLRRVDGEKRAQWYIKCANGCKVEEVGMQRLPSMTERYKRGEALPIHVINNIEKRSKSMAAAKSTAITTTIPEETRKEIAEWLGGFCTKSGETPSQKEISKAIALTKWGFEPQMHMMMYQGKLLIDKGGWWWWAGQDKRFERIVTRALITKEERDAYGVLPNEIGVIASLYVKGQKEPYTTGFGRASKTSTTPVVRGSAVEANHPYLMAEKRAEVQVIKKFRPLGEPPNVTAEDIAAMKEVVSSEESNIVEGAVRDISDATEIPPSDAGSPAAATEAPLVEETPAVDPYPLFTAKYGDIIGCCPTHGEGWRIDKFKKRSHFVSEGVWCTFKGIISLPRKDKDGNELPPIMKEICDNVGIDAKALNEKCKEKFEGKTSSQISEESLIGILEELMAEADKKGIAGKLPI